MRVRVTLEIEMKSAMSVGAGQLTESLVDKSIAKDVTRWPVIPASTVKGMLRSQCERLARSLGLHVCHAPKPASMCLGERRCIICALFGSPWHESKVVFSDLVLSEPRRVAPESLVVVRPGIAVSRRRRTVEEGRLFFTETVIGGLVFRGEIYAELDESEGGVSAEEASLDKRLGLLLFGLQTLAGFGGKGSSGLGWCAVTYKVYKDGVEIVDEELARILEEWQ